MRRDSLPVVSVGLARWCRMDTPAKPRIGLVLEGGGAKGAYGFGCLKAFAEAGIRFDAIAGTSVGAINAVLFATGDIQFGEAYWRSISHQRVYRWQLLGIALLPLRFVIRILGEVASLVLAPIFGLVTGLGFILAFLLQAFLYTLVVGLLVYGASYLFGWETGLEWSTGLLSMARLPLYLFGILCILLIPVFLNQAGLTLFQPEKLREEVVRAVAELDASKVPVYVTASERTQLIDPDRVPGWVMHGDIKPFEISIECPVYFKLNDLTTEERANAVMASAALPLGVFPSVPVAKKYYTDGGTVDNVPVYPLIWIDPCDVLVVVRLRPVVHEVPSDKPASYIDYACECDRLVN